MSRCAATARASSTSRGPQHRPFATLVPRGSCRRIVIPTTRQPASTRSAAAVALSTPPDSAATTRVSAPGSARGAGASMLWYSLARMSRTCVVQATSLDEHGLGIGDAGGRALHVTDLLPGERAEVAIEHVSPH